MSIPEPSVYLFFNVQAKQAQEKSKVNEQTYHIKKKKKKKLESTIWLGDRPRNQ